MKNLIIVFLSVLAITLTFSGCGESEGSSTSSVSSVANIDGGSVEDIGLEEAVIVVANNGTPEDTVARMPYNLSDALGVPPGIPAD